MRFTIDPLQEADARAILGWQYEGIYAFYNADPALATGNLAEMLDGSFYAARDEQGELVGFFCFGAPARVPGGYTHGVYADGDALDLGLGLRPDLTGRGWGAGFVAAGLDFAARRFAPALVRLAVATFNERAIRVYERRGFRRAALFTSRTNGGETAFLLMTLRVGDGR